MFTFLNFSDTYFVISALVLTIAYIISLYFIGLGQLHLVSLMGDKTVLRKFAPSKMYPFEHFDIPGYIFLLLTGFGWSKTFEVKQYAISGNHKKMRIFIARNAQIITCLVGATIVAFLLFLDFGNAGTSSLLDVISHVSKTDPSNLIKIVLASFPTMSSFSLAIGLILSSIILFCAANATLHIFLSGIQWLYGRTSLQANVLDEAFLAETIVSMILFMYFRKKLFVLVIGFIIGIAQLLALLLGIF